MDLIYIILFFILLFYILYSLLFLRFANFLKLRMFNTLRRKDLVPLALVIIWNEKITKFPILSCDNRVQMKLTTIFVFNKKDTLVS